MLAQRLGSDRDKTAKGTVERHGQIDLTVEQQRRDDRHNNTGSSSNVGVHEDVGDSNTSAALPMPAESRH